VTFEDHFRTGVTLCAQLTRDLFAIDEFLVMIIVVIVVRVSLAFFRLTTAENKCYKPTSQTAERDCSAMG